MCYIPYAAWNMSLKKCISRNTAGTTGKIVNGRDFVSFHDILSLWLISVMVDKLEYFFLYEGLFFFFFFNFPDMSNYAVLYQGKELLSPKFFLSLKVTDQST